MVTKTEMKQLDAIMNNITKTVDKIRKRKVELEKQQLKNQFGLQKTIISKRRKS